jgi:hypothetical protein
MGGEFTEREPGSGDEIQLSQLIPEHFQNCKAVHVERDLTARSLGQFIERAIKSDFTDRVSKRCVRFSKTVRNNCKLLGEVFSHADLLRALAGKEKSEGSGHDGWKS